MIKEADRLSNIPLDQRLTCLEKILRQQLLAKKQQAQVNVF